jgi:hypothetical protein
MADISKRVTIEPLQIKKAGKISSAEPFDPKVGQTFAKILLGSSPRAGTPREFNPLL